MNRRTQALILLVATAVLVSCGPSLPTKIFLSQQETRAFPLDDIYLGFNVSYTIQSTFATLSNKADWIDKSRDFELPIKWVSWWIERDIQGNWQKQMALLDDERNVYVGYVPNPDGAPVLQGSVNFEKDARVKCFDIVRVAPNKLYVDCALIEYGDNSTVNTFYLIDTSNLQVKKIRNLNVTTPTCQFGRRLTSYSVGGLNFVLRYMPYTTLPTNISTNSFIELFVIDENQNAIPFDVIDRTVLNSTTVRVDELRIQDVQVLYDEIYILDHTLGIFRVKLLPTNKYDVAYFKSRYDGLNNMKIYTDYIDEHQIVTILVSNIENLFEIDWTLRDAPYEVRRYELGRTTETIKIDMSNNYVIAQTYTKYNTENSVNNNSTAEPQPDEYFIKVYRRGRKNADYIHYAFDYSNDTNVEFEYNGASDAIMLVGSKNIQTYSINRGYLYINRAPDNGTWHLKLQAATTRNTKTSLIATTYLDVVVFKMTDNTIVNSQPNYNQFLLQYPGSTKVSIDDVLSGPNINYNVLSNATEGLRANVSIMDEISIRFPPIPTEDENGLGVGSIAFTQFDLAYENSPLKGTFIWFLQTSKNILRTYFCNVSNLTNSMSCEKTYIDDIQLGGPIAKMLLTERHFLVKSRDNPLVVRVFNLSSGFEKNQLAFTDPRDECIDIDLLNTEDQGTIIVCTQAGRGQILLFKFDDYTEELREVSSLNKRSLNINDFFKPQIVYTNQNFPGILFVMDNFARVLVIGCGILERTVPVVLDTIDSQLTLSDNFDMVLAGSRLVLLGDNNEIEEWNIEDLESTIFEKNYPTFGIKFPRYQGSYDLSRESNLFYIHGIDSADPDCKSKIVIYRAGAIYRDVYYQTLNLSNSDQDVISLQSAPSLEDGVDFLLVQTGDNAVRLFKVFQEPKFEITSIPSNITAEVSFTSLVNITATNAVSESKVEIANSIVVFNTKANLTRTVPNNAVLTLSVNLPTKDDEYTETVFDDNQEVNAAVFDYNITGCDGIECDPVNGSIAVINPIQFTQKLLDFGHRRRVIQDFTTIGHQVFTLFEQDIYVVHGGHPETILNIISLSAWLDPTFVCRRTTQDPTNTVLAILCEDDQSEVVRILVLSLATEDPFVILSKDVSSIQDVSDLRYYDNYLFVLSTNRDDPEAYDGTVVVFNIDLASDSDTRPTITQCDRIITADLFDVPDLPISSFDVYSHQSGDYFIMLLDTNFGIRMTRITITESFIEYKRTDNLALVGNWANEFAQLVPIKFSGIRVSNVLGNSTAKWLAFHTVVTTQNFHHYELLLNLTTYINVRTLAVHYRYGDYVVQNRISQAKDVFVVVARNETAASNLSDVYLVYRKATIQDYFAIQPYPNYTLVGGHTVYRPTTDVEGLYVHTLWTCPKSNKTKLFAFNEFDNVILKEFHVAKQPFIRISSSSVRTTSFRLEARNSYSNAQVQVNLRTKKLNGGVSAIVVIMIIVAIVVIGGVIYYLSQSKNRQEEADEETGGRPTNDTPLLK